MAPSAMSRFVPLAALLVIGPGTANSGRSRARASSAV